MDVNEFLEREIKELGLSQKKEESKVKVSSEPEQTEESYSQRQLFEKIKIKLDQGKLDDAKKYYLSLWNIFLKQGIKWDEELHDMLSILSTEFSKLLDKEYLEIKNKIEDAHELINKGKLALKEGKIEFSSEINFKLEEIKNSLQDTYFEKKSALIYQITDFLKELKKAKDDLLIKEFIGFATSLNILIKKMETDISLNDTKNGIADYKNLIEIYSRIPEGFLRYKNTVGIRILGIYKTLTWKLLK